MKKDLLGHDQTENAFEKFGFAKQDSFLRKVSCWTFGWMSVLANVRQELVLLVVTEHSANELSQKKPKFAWFPHEVAEWTPWEKVPMFICYSVERPKLKIVW